MNQAPFIQGPNVILRKPNESDIQDRFDSGSSYEWVRMLGGDTRNMQPYTREKAQKWFDDINSKPLEWAIEYKGKCIGQARLTVNTDDQRARYAVGIFNDQILGQGIGTEVTKLVLSYAFEILKLHRVDLKVLSYNTRAIACYEKCGFIKEGIEREGAGAWAGIG